MLTASIVQALLLAYWTTKGLTSSFVVPSVQNSNPANIHPVVTECTWSRALAPDPRPWQAVDVDATGQYGVAAVYVGSSGIWFTEDFGQTWTQSNAPSTATTWFAIAMSKLGRQAYAVERVGGVWKSADFGRTWTLTSAPSTGSLSVWGAIATDSTGERVVAVGDSIFLSADAGFTWSRDTNDAPKGVIWTGVASSDSGQFLVAAGRLVAGLYTSSDFGRTWSLSFSSDIFTLFRVASSATGEYLAGIVEGGFRVLVSADFGVTWIATSSSPIRNWISVAIDAAGQNIVAGSTGSDAGELWKTDNFGVDWTQQVVPLAGWQSVASSDSGRVVVAVIDAGGVYVSNDCASGDSMTSAPSLLPGQPPPSLSTTPTSSPSETPASTLDPSSTSVSKPTIQPTISSSRPTNPPYRWWWSRSRPPR